jgi:hypothetical protein
MIHFVAFTCKEKIISLTTHARNMPDVEIFDSESQVIAFIKKQFPL